MNKNQLSRYLSPPKSRYLICLFFVALGIALCALEAVASPFGCMLLMFGFAAFFGVMTHNKSKKVSEALEYLNRQNQLEQVLNDFNGARPMLNDRLRLGQTYIFGKHTGEMIRYTDISRVYRHHSYSQGVLYKSELRALGTSKSVYTLCRLPAKGIKEGELKQVLMEIFLHNPRITF